MLKKSVYSGLLLFALICTYSLSAYAGNAELSWDPPAINEDGSIVNDLGGYIIYYGTSPGYYSASIDVRNVNSYAINNLPEGSTYYFAVTAYDVYGNESGYSAETSKRIVSLDSIPPDISGVYAENITSHEVTINWMTNEPADSKVEYGPDQSFEYASAPDPAMVTNHSQTISVGPSTDYYYRVISQDESGNISDSDTYSFTSAAMQDLTPPDIVSIQVNNITESSATITWTTNEPSTSQVEYGYNTHYGHLSAPDTRLVTMHTVVLDGLSSYSTYNFRVRSTDAAYNEAVSENHTFNTSNVPPVISSFEANQTSGYTSMSTDFSSSSFDSDGYIVRHEWDLDGDGTYEQDTGAHPDTSFMYTQAGTYNARVRVTDDGGASAVSQSIRIVVEDAVNYPPEVTSTTASPSSGEAPLTTTLSAEAADPDGSIAQYEWDFDGNGIYDAATESGAVTHVYHDTGTYTARVRVTDSDGGTATGETQIRAEKHSRKSKRDWKQWKTDLRRRIRGH